MRKLKRLVYLDWDSLAHNSYSMRQVFVTQSFAMVFCLLLALLVWARGSVINLGITSEPIINDAFIQKKPTKKRVDNSQLAPESRNIEVEHLVQREVVESASSTYVVKSGDTLGHIAQRFKISVAKLKAMNELRSDVITVGRELTVSQGQ